MRRTTVFLAILALIMPAAMGHAQPALQGAEVDQPPAPRAITLFTAVAVPQTAIPLKQSRGFTAVRPDMAAAKSVREGDTLNLDVAANVVIPIRADRVVRRSPDQLSIFGSVPGAPFSSAILVVEYDALAGDIRVPTAAQHFRMRYVADGVHLVCDIDDRLYGECGGGGPLPPNIPRGFDPSPESEPPVEPPPGFEPRGTCSNIETTFDIMVVYTDIARAAAGGTNAIRAEIQLGCDTADQTYDNSNVFAHYRLVWQGEVSYNESGALTDHRDRLANPSDGYFDWAVTTRDDYNADMCAIWVDDDDAGQWCGFAYCDFDYDSAYCCVNWQCAAGNFSFPHEFGHDQGCAHNTEDAGSGCNEYSYSYGHRFFASGNGYRTVMAYNNSNGDYTRIGYWSNPDVTYLGVATGSATHDNARTLNNTRSTVEGWELTRYDIWIDADPAVPSIQNGTYAFPYDTAAEGFSAIEVPHSSVSEIPVLHAVTGQYNYTGTVSKKMTIIPCSGSATIGTP